MNKYDFSKASIISLTTLYSILTNFINNENNYKQMSEE